MNPTEWRAFCAREPVLENRLQTFAFLTGEELEPVPLRTMTRHHFRPGTKHKLADWINPDVFQYPTLDFNIGALLRKPFIDLDVDCDPVRGPRDAVFLAEVARILDIVEANLKACDIDYRAYGRTSTGRRGHFIIPVPTSKTKALDEEAILTQLQMAKKCVVGNVKVMIEVRRPSAEKKGVGKKNATMPGSVYPSEVDGTPDLLQWHVLGTFKEGEATARMTPTDVGKLRLAIYSSIMTLAVLDHWVKGSRHATALHVTGILAHEHMRGGLTEAECAFILDQIVIATNDDEPEMRDTLLSDSIHSVGKRRMYGYTSFGENIDEDWKGALLRLRGGNSDDPDALARLFEIVVRVRLARKGSDAYLDLSAGADAYVELEQPKLRIRFKQRPEFPKVPDRYGKPTDAIEIVLHSDSIRTYDRALSFPGIDFGTIFHFDTDGDDWIETTEARPAPEGAITGINVAPGFKTKLDAAVTRRDYNEARRLWYRLRAHLTQDDPASNARLDQVIARKLQRPRDKYPVGVALVGGMGTGKSFFFHVMLSKLLGENLLKIGNTSELNNRFRFNEIERVLFYVIEECRFDVLPPDTLQLIKDVMRNPRIFRDAKYGGIGTTTNAAVPFFLSNEANPKLMFDGHADRALIVIRGESPESTGMSVDEWKIYSKITIHGECQEFMAALGDPLIRRALLWYFLDLDLDEDLAYDVEDADSNDLRRGLSPALNALAEMFETGWILPERRGDRGPTIEDPFTMGTLALGVRERLRNQGVSTFPTSNQGIGQLIADLFRENTHKGGKRHDSVDRDRREGKVLASRKFYGDTDGPRPRMYYFSLERGALLQLLKEKRGIELEPEYDLREGGEMGLRPAPSVEAMQKALAFATELSMLQKYRDMGF